MTVRRCRFVGEHFSVECSYFFFVLIRLLVIDLWLQSKSFRSRPTKKIAYIGENELGVKRMKTSNSRRTVPIPPTLRRALMEYRNLRVLYCHGRLTRYQRSNYLNYVLQRILPDHTMHDFRHTYATRLLSSGMDIKTVTSLLGDTVATVERVYIHYTDEMRAKAAEDINRIFG